MDKSYAARISCPSFALTLVHGIDDKGNGHWQHNETIDLLAHVSGISSKGQYGYGSTRQNDGNVHPSQERSLIGKEDFRFHLDGGTAWFYHFLFGGGSSLASRIFRSIGAKQLCKETGLAVTTFLL